MKFSKFFEDFSAGFLRSQDANEMSQIVTDSIQFPRLKKVLSMIATDDVIDIEKLTEFERVVASSCTRATELFTNLLLAQLDQADRRYCLMVRALPQRLQRSFKLSLYDDFSPSNGSLFTIRKDRIEYTGLSSLFPETDEAGNLIPPPEEVEGGARLVQFLEPLGDFFYSIADETMKIGNFSYMNFTAGRKIIKKWKKLNPSENNFLHVSGIFEKTHFFQDQGKVKNLLSSLMPGLAVQSSHQLLAAAREGDMELVRKLFLLQGGDINFPSPSDGRTALHIAAGNCHDKVVELLLSFNANVHAADCSGMTPLGSALLEDSSSSLVSASMIRAAGGELMLPASVEKLHALSLSAVDAAARGDLGRLRKLWAAGIALADERSFALHSASQNGHLEVCRFLLEIGEQPHSKDKSGKTAIDVVSLDADEGLVALLLSWEGNVKVPKDRLSYLLGPVPISVPVLSSKKAPIGHMANTIGKPGSPIAESLSDPLVLRSHGILLQARIAIRRILPIWLIEYNWRRDFRDDALSGLSLSGMFIPGSMALASLIGIPPVFGIYSGVLSPVIYGLFASSRHLCVGPLSVVSLLIGEALSEVDGGATPGNCVLFAVEVGAIFFIMGFMRLGFFAHFLSGPALAGFTTAAAILTVAAQFNGLIGTTLQGQNSLLIHKIIQRNFHVITSAKLSTVLLSVVCIAAIFLLRKKLPGKLAMMSGGIVMVLSLIISVIFRLQSFGFSVVGSVERGLPSFVMPSALSFGDAFQLLPSAAFIGVVGFIESIASAKKCAQKYGYKIDNDRELWVLGLSNLAMPLTGGFPVFGSLSATAANAELGGQTPMVLFVRSAVLILVLVALTGVFAPLPKCVLGVIIVMAVYTMIDFTAIPRLWIASKPDLTVWLSACVLTLFCGVQVGMATAAGLSLLVFILRTSMPRVVVMAREIGSLHFVPIQLDERSADVRNTIFGYMMPAVLKRRQSEVSEPAVDRKGVLVLSFQAPLWYANADLLKEKTISVLSMPKVHAVIVDMSAVSFVDTTAIETLKELADFVKKLNGSKAIIFATVNLRVAKSLFTNGLHEAFSGLIANQTEIPTFVEPTPVTYDNIFADTIYEGVRRSNICWAEYKRKFVESPTLIKTKEEP